MTINWQTSQLLDIFRPWEFSVKELKTKEPEVLAPANAAAKNLPQLEIYLNKLVLRGCQF